MNIYVYQKVSLYKLLCTVNNYNKAIEKVVFKVQLTLSGLPQLSCKSSLSSGVYVIQHTSLFLGYPSGSAGKEFPPLQCGRDLGSDSLVGKIPEGKNYPPSILA